MNLDRISAGAIVGAFILGAWTVSAAPVNPDDFESYPTGAWTPAGPPTATNEGWTVTQIAGTPIFGLDSDSGLFGASQGLRIAANTTSDDRALATWHASADITVLPQQTLYTEWQGVFRRTGGSGSFGRVVFNQTSANANFLEMRSDAAGVQLRTAGGDVPLPENAVSFSWPSDSLPTLWFALEIQMDYTAGRIRARFGNRPNLVDPTVWNDYTDWKDMADTSQQSEVRTFVEGRVHMDNFSLTAEPAVVASTNIVVADTAGIAFDSVSGLTYSLQSTPDLVSSNFSDTGAFVTGDDGPLTLFDPTGTSTSKNYRVLATN